MGAGKALDDFTTKMEKARDAVERMTTSLEKNAAAARDAKSANEAAANAAEFSIDKMGAGIRGVALSIEAAGQALAKMAHQVDQMKTSVYDGNAKVKELLATIDGMVSDSKIQIYLNGIMNKFKEGTISYQEMKDQIRQTYEGLERLNAQGNGFLGDLNGQALKLEGVLQDLDQEINHARADAEKLGDAVEQAAAGGIGGGGGGDAGSTSTGGGPTGPTRGSGMSGAETFTGITITAAAAPNTLRDFARRLREDRLRRGAPPVVR